jgi:glutamate synthase domain-containing protein 2
MKTLQEISVELKALATVTEDQFEASLASVVADLDAVIGATGGTVADPVVSVATVTASGVKTVFVPQTA